MPHLTPEYSDNIEVDVQPLLARLHEEVVATGAINLKGIKSRAIKQTRTIPHCGWESRLCFCACWSVDP